MISSVFSLTIFLTLLISGCYGVIYAIRNGRSVLVYGLFGYFFSVFPLTLAMIFSAFTGAFFNVSNKTYDWIFLFADILILFICKKWIEKRSKKRKTLDATAPVSISRLNGSSYYSHTKSINESKNDNGYKAKSGALTYREKTFYKILKQQCDAKGYTVNFKTRLEDIIESTSYGKQKFSERGKLRARHIDFAVLDDDLKYIFCIELDDSTHNSKKAQEIDKMKNYIFESTGLPLYRVKIGDNFETEIKSILERY